MPHGLPRARWGEPAASDERVRQLRSIQDERAQEPTAADEGAPLLELAYYALEPDLLALMRALAVLDPQQRAKVLAYAQAMCAEAGPTDL